MAFEWEGSLRDDCSLRVGPYVAHCENLDDLVCVSALDVDIRDESPDAWLAESWYMSITRTTDKEQIFHSGEHGGRFSSGDLARAAAEAIIRALMAEPTDKVAG